MSGTLLLDFPGAPPRAFAEPERLLVARTTADVRPVLHAAHAWALRGRWVAGWVSYEAAPAFDRVLRVRPGAQLPLAWFGVYREPRPPAHPDPSAGDAGPDLPRWNPTSTAAEHADAVARIRAAIARGDVYQVNHTLRLRARHPGAARALFERLRAAQPDAYAAFLEAGDFRILSLSPELFFERRGEVVRTRPMKGTRARGRWLEEDEALAAELLHSEKDRAENLMIVDLLRNDLGRVAKTGTVRVPQLFALERYRTVWQMTSTIEAEVPRGCALPELFAALFPCGSVTGAPKIAAMRFIAELESAPREVYCGAIGVLEPGGDCTFSVAIRTAWQDAASGELTYGAGGGITWDSVAEEEWQEAQSKAAVLARAWPRSFHLLETMRAEAGVLVRPERHLQRLLDSARYFGFRAERAAVTAALARVVRGEDTQRVRLLLGEDGTVAVQTSPLEPTPAAFPLVLAATPVDSRDPFLFHKTTHREEYARRAAERPDAFDVLLANERGELTEFTRGNLVLELAGELWTPPREAGLLAGTFRAELLARGLVRERTLLPADLGRARRAWLVNSLREWVPAELP